jgi:selenocysteine lyase/cysteine desulfurase
MDALFFSPHKFIGGVGTPGVLIAKEELFMKRQPYCAGGGCVVKVKDDKIEYEFDIEKRETAGTPNIIGIIKVWLSLQIKNGLKKVIVKNEEYMIKELEDLEKELEKINKDFYRVMYNKKYKYLPIFSFGIKGIHFNLLVILLNDKYGIQSRGGISCCGLLADYVESKIGCRGWCRVTFHWSMTLDEIEYIKNGIIDIVKNIEIYKKLYSYDENTHLFSIN